LHSILEYISPVSETSGAGGKAKAIYGVGELVKGARDAEDAIKKFKEDGGRFVRPVVCIGRFGLMGFQCLLGGFCADWVIFDARLWTGLMAVLLLGTMSLRF
jgi:hypothetical protein